MIMMMAMTSAITVETHEREDEAAVVAALLWTAADGGCGCPCATTPPALPESVAVVSPSPF